MSESGEHILNIPLLPLYVTPVNTTFSGKIKNGLTWAGDYQVDNVNSFDCLTNSSFCDVDTRRVEDDFLISTFDNHNAVVNWVPCRFVYKNYDLVQVQILKVGTNLLEHVEGDLHCGSRHIKLSPSQLNGKILIKVNNVTLNPVRGFLVPRIPITDPDHALNNVYIYRRVTLSHILYVITFVAFMGVFIFMVTTYFKLRAIIPSVLGQPRIF